MMLSVYKVNTGWKDTKIVADLALSMVHYLVAINESMMVKHLEYCLALMTDQKMAQ